MYWCDTAHFIWALTTALGSLIFWWFMTVCWSLSVASYLPLTGSCILCYYHCQHWLFTAMSGGAADSYRDSEDFSSCLSTASRRFVVITCGNSSADWLKIWAAVFYAVHVTELITVAERTRGASAYWHGAFVITAWAAFLWCSYGTIWAGLIKWKTHGFRPWDGQQKSRN